MRSADGRVYALTYRIGRHIPGLADIFLDLLQGGWMGRHTLHRSCLHIFATTRCILGCIWQVYFCRHLRVRELQAQHASRQFDVRTFDGSHG